MKKIWNKIKDVKHWSLFAKLVTAYMLLFAIVIVVICVWEWNALADYEADNQAAKKNSNPDVYISSYVEEFTREKYEAILTESIEAGGNAFYTTDTLVDYVSGGYDNGDIKSEKNDKWTESRPAYDIYAGDELLLTLTLGVKSKDDFGYNIWKEGEIKLASELVFDNEVSLIADSDMKVTVNGVEVTSEYITDVENSDAVNERIAELVDGEYKLYRYSISNLLEGYELKVTDSMGNELSYVDNDGVRDYSVRATGDVMADIESRVTDTMEAYAKIINKVIDRSNMTKYFYEDGPLYEIFGSQQFKDSMYWNFAARSIEFVREDVTDIRFVSEDIFVCNIDFEANKTYDRKYNVNENLLNETFRGEAVFVKVGEEWYLDTLKLQ